MRKEKVRKSQWLQKYHVDGPASYHCSGAHATVLFCHVLENGRHIVVSQDSGIQQRSLDGTGMVLKERFESHDSASKTQIKEKEKVLEGLLPLAP